MVIKTVRTNIRVLQRWRRRTEDLLVDCLVLSGESCGAVWRMSYEFYKLRALHVVFSFK